MYQVSCPISENADCYFICKGNNPSGQGQESCLLQKFPTASKVQLTIYPTDIVERFASDKFVAA